MNHGTQYRSLRALSLALCVLLLVSLLALAACGGDDTEGSTAAATDTEAATDTAATDADTEAVTDPDTDTDSEPASESETEPAKETAIETGTEVSTVAPETDTESATDASTEPESATEVTTETDTAAATATATEAEPTTAPERYDYISADVSADVDIQPSDYTEMKLTLPSYLQITEQDVQDYIYSSILFQYRTADNGTAKMTDSKMKKGDSAFIYYKGEIDGVAFDGGSNWEETSPYELKLGSGSFIPGFEDGLIGVIPAMTSREKPAKVQATFPEDYGKEELNGKTATFYVYVEYAVQYSLPEYNRDFVENTLQYEGQKDFYAGDKAYLQEFEQYVKTFLEKQIAEDVAYAKTDALWIYLTQTAVCRNLPELEINYYLDSYKNQIGYMYKQYSSYYGESFTTAYPDEASFAVWYMGLTSAEVWEEELYDLVVRMVKKDMITHAIAEQQGMETVSEEEYKAVVEEWVSYYYGQLTAEEIEQQMGETFLKQSVVSEKVQAWLMEQAEFSYSE